MRTTIRLLLVGMTLFLSACKTPNPLPVAFYETDQRHQLPPINFFSKPPSAELEELCRTARCSDSDDTAYVIFMQLQASQSFVNVNAGKSDQTEYAIHTVTRVIHPENEVAEAAKILLSAGTLFVVPASIEQEYHTEFVVTWRKVPIASYEFTTPHKKVASLFLDPQHQNQFVAESASSQLIAALQGDNIFTSERIYNVLQADDYHRDLQPPLQIGDYRHTDFRLFPDPLLGVQLRYAHNAVKEEAADVFVYPIRQVEWADADQTANTEIQSVLREVEFAIKAGAYRAATHDEPAPIMLHSGNREFRGRRTTGTITLQSGQILADYIYIFTLKDKYIKFRFTRPTGAAAAETTLNNFVRDFLVGATIPDESLFMASIRQQRRDSEAQ
jgi:hypothetical protein